MNKAQYTYDEVRSFAELIAVLANEQLPDTTTVERPLEKKAGKIYLDYLQNKKGQTLASVYSLRPKAGATISTPLTWKEVRPGLHPSMFTIRNITSRLDKIGGLIPKGSLPDALWWDTGNLKSKWIVDPYHYIRIQHHSEQYDLLIAGGEDHKTGQADEENIPEEERFSKLEGWVRQHFPMMEEIVYHWSGQVLEPLDSLAFIGRNPGNKNTFIATGDSGNGMTHGTIAGLLITDLIQGIENPWEKMYDPSRITLKVTGDYLKEAGNMAAQYGDYLKSGDLKSLEELPVNQGAVITMGLKKVAVYRDQAKVLHAYSAICPHLGCVLQWNGSESSFDCPCHGSRFTCEGKVVNGPAISDLKKEDLE